MYLDLQNLAQTTLYYSLNFDGLGELLEFAVHQKKTDLMIDQFSKVQNCYVIEYQLAIKVGKYSKISIIHKDFSKKLQQDIKSK